ncbi:GNAT family N-acetyltransferase [Pontibacter vulgaris]|uniref:GNAT family N-acetyltransferase n=1 Tax=Pontibacter vulgaris TaxID=2905679 RepID=UPI001FA7292C|nr:GNAT family N-acetyltransferase [Pontibacter vulgaris]
MEEVAIKRNDFYGKVRKGWELLAKGNVRDAWKLTNNRLYSIAAKERIYSTRYWYGLKRYLVDDFQNPKAKINITVRPLEERDIDYLLDTTGLTEKEVKQINYQRKLVNSNLQTCFVAVTEDGKPCYMQWLVGPANNHKIRSTFNGLFPQLKANEALLEGAYMHPAYRGLGIMPDAMCQIAEKAADIGASEVITFVKLNNIPSLKGCRGCGFSPYSLLQETWLLKRKYVTMPPVPPKLLKEYDIATASKPKTA